MSKHSQPSSSVSTVRLAGLEEFLETGGNTLLIKGDAGSGKTTLAIQLMKKFASGGDAYYISARVSKEKLERQSPESAKAVEGVEGGGFVDLRLGNSAHMLEEIIKALRGKESKNTQVLVVDTWDSFAKEIEEKERMKAEKTLMALADMSNARIIFVSEEPERTTMEYLVDGIVVLRRIDEDGLLLREFELTKLRGTAIPQHKHLFSLDGGVFTAFDYHLRPDYSKARKVSPKKDLDDAFSLGSAALDDVFYGIPKGSTFALEYEPKVHYSSIRIVDLLALINALNNGHGAFLLPLPASPLPELAGLIRPYVSKEAYLNNLVIASMEKTNENLKPPFYPVGANDDRNLGENITVLLEKVRENSRTGGVLAIESMVQLESAFASTSDTVLKGLSSRVSKIQKNTNDALLVTLNSGARMKQRVLAMSRRYLRILMRDRVAVVVGEKPSTEPFVLERSEENSLLPKLTRIV